jgi:Fe-S-cluster containining protein
VVAGLKDKREALLERTGSPKGLFFAVPVGEDGQSKDQIVCHSRGGSCVFLSSEDRCIIHEDYGPQYKPEVCRLFPYQFIATPNGIAVSLSMECRGFAQARGGQPLRNQEKGLRELLSIIPNLRRVRPVILLDDLNPMAYPDYEALEQALHDVVDDQAGDPAQTLLAMRQCVLDALGQGAQEDGGGSDPQTLRDHIVALMQGIDELAEFLTRKYQRDDEEGRVYTETMDELSTAATAFVADLPRIVGPLSSSSQRQVFQQVIHHHLMNKELCSARTLVLGLARLTFSWLMSRALMIARARQVKRRHLVDQDIMDGVVVLNFLMRNQGFMNAFQSFDDALVSLFYERLPALFTHAKEIAGADTRVDFYKF